jgi:small-conductance mechanosensitive channel
MTLLSLPRCVCGALIGATLALAVLAAPGAAASAGSFITDDHGTTGGIGGPRMAMQSRVVLLVDDAHRQSIASWHRLQAAPEDLTSVVASWSAAWASGDGLRAITYALILLLIGGGVEWLYWCYAGRARQAIAEAVVAESGGGAMRPRRAASLSGRQALLEACGCAVFAVSTVGACTAFSWPAGVQQAVVGSALVVTAIRLTGIAVGALLAPERPQLRLLSLDDAAARRVRVIAIGLAALVTGGSALQALCEGPLAAPALAFAVSVTASAAVCGFALDGIRLWSARPKTGGRSVARATASAVLPFLGAVAALGAFALVLVGAKRLSSTIAIIFLAILAHRMVSGLIDVFTAKAAAKPSEDFDCRISAYRPVLRRIALFAVIGSALGALAGEWGVSMRDMSQSRGAIGGVLARALDVTVVLLLADLVWLWARTAIDRRVAVFAPRPREGLPVGISDSGTRLATLLPLLRKAVLVVIMTAATLISLSSLGVNIAPLLAGAGVVGIAIGFGAQTLVRDIVSGIFYLLEDTFRIGEYVEFGQTRGTVESISLRFLRLRHHRGAVHTIPFGEIRWLTNQSRDWQIMKLEFRVPFDTDMRLVKKLVGRVGEDLLQDEELGPWLIEPVKSRGVIRMEEFCAVLGIKFTARPGDGMFLVRREAYHRILEAFAANGIRFADRHKVELLAGGPREAPVRALPGGAEAAIVPLSAPLASADQRHPLGAEPRPS